MQGKRFVTSILSALVLSACSSYQAVYMNEYSRAFNLAQRGGISLLKDTSITQKQQDALSFSKELTRDTLLFTRNVGLGLNFASGLGLGLLNSFFKPTPNNERDSLFAWMPIELADSKDEARLVMLDKLDEATLALFDELEVTYAPLKRKRDDNIAYQFINEDIGCPKYIGHTQTKQQRKAYQKNYCFIYFHIRQPKPAPPPLFVSNQATAYKFDSGHKTKYQRFDIIKGANATFNVDDLYSTLSKHLPDWIFLYVANDNVNYGKHKVETNYVLEKGTLNFFVKIED